MTTYRIDVKKPALRFISTQNPKNQIRILSAISQLPDVGDIVPMKGQSGYRLRIGSYRIIFERDDSNMLVTVKRIGSRGDVYKK